MKLIMTRIQPHRLDLVHEALLDIGISDLTAIEVKGFGGAVDHAEISRGAAYRVTFMPMVKIEVVVEDDRVEQVVSAINLAGAASPEQRGPVWVFDVLAAVAGEGDPR